MNINTVTLTGRWVTDFELKEFGENKKASGRIAVQNTKDSSSFFDVIFWGKTAEIASQFCKKGGFAGIEGRLEQESWETSEGQKRSKVIIVGNRLDLGPKQSGQESSPAASSPKAKAKSEDDDDLGVF